MPGMVLITIQDEYFNVMNRDDPQYWIPKSGCLPLKGIYAYPYGSTKVG